MRSTAKRGSNQRTLLLTAFFTLTLVLISLPPVITVAGETKSQPVAQMAVAINDVKISKEQATEAALRALPGEVTDVTVERKRGKMVYVIEIVAKKNGAETDVLVDMDSGQVLGME